MLDCHIHISLDGIDFKKCRQRNKNEAIKDTIRDILKEYKKNNIILLRDGGDDMGISKIAKDIAIEEDMIFKSPIKAIYKKDHYGKFLGYGVGNCKEFEDVFKIFKSDLDHLKIILTSIVNFNVYNDKVPVCFSKKEFEYMINTAKKNNISTMVHANSKLGIQMAIDAGVSSIEHGYFIENEQIHQMKEKGIIWIPTLSPLANLIKYGCSGVGSVGVINKVLENHLKSVEYAYSINAKFSIGSDSGSYRVRHAQGTFEEINYLLSITKYKKHLLKKLLKSGIELCGLNSEELKIVNKHNYFQKNVD